MVVSSKTWAGSTTTYEHVVLDKHDHMVVLQQNTTELLLGTIIEDIEVLVHLSMNFLSLNKSVSGVVC